LLAISFAASIPLAPIFSILPAAQHGWRLNWTAANTMTPTMFAARWLQSEGWRVLRFWNNEFEEYEDAVMERILEALESPMPSPRPSP
jgi:hypothetical protein